jgi:shikimate kinase
VHTDSGSSSDLISATPARRTVVLIGLRASGKSTVGRLLAERLGGSFVDLDDLTAVRLGAPTAGAALAGHGEPTFRAAEAAALAEVLRSPPGVLALGGGTPTAPEAATMLREGRAGGRLLIVYLRAEPATLIERLLGDTALRPALTGLTAGEEVRALFQARDGLYSALAEVSIVAEGMTAEGLAAEIARLL